MNKWILSLGLLTASIQPICMHASSASEEQISDFPFQYAWSGTENDLFFNIEVPQGFVFPDSYSIISIANGQGCEIVCQAEPGNETNITELTISVILRNTDDRNQLGFEIESKASYVDSGWFTSTTTNRTITRTGTVRNPMVDLETKPKFTTFNDKKNAAFFSFKNAFPYSEM